MYIYVRVYINTWLSFFFVSNCSRTRVLLMMKDCLAAIQQSQALILSKLMGSDALTLESGKIKSAPAILPPASITQLSSPVTQPPTPAMPLSAMPAAPITGPTSSTPVPKYVPVKCIYLERQMSSFRDSLHEVVEDMMDRVQDGDHNYISGLCKCISLYKALESKSIAPTASCNCLCLTQLWTSCTPGSLQWNQLL